MQSEILSVFEKQMRLRGLAKTTIRSYVQAIKDFFLFSQDITLSQAAEYLNLKKIQVDNRKLSRSHYNQIQYAFDKYWSIFYQKRFPLLNHIEVPTIPPKVISEEKIVEALTKMQNRQHQIIFSFGYFSMLRRAEIWHLDLYKDIDTENYKVYVRAGKGWKPRVTVLAEFTRQLVLEERQERDRKEKNPWVCAKPGTRNRYLSYSEIGRIVAEAGDIVGCRNWHPHLLRHTGATHYDQQGVSTRKIQRLEGHSRLNTTQGYITHTQDQVLEVRNKLDILLLQSKKNVNNG